MFSLLDSQCPTWHGNCFVSFFKWNWNCMVKQFWHWSFGLFDVFLDDTSVQFTLILCFVLGWQQPNPVWFDIDISINWPFSILHEVFLCVSFQMRLKLCEQAVSIQTLVWSIWFYSLDEHNLIHLQLIFHFVANFYSAF